MRDSDRGDAKETIAPFASLPGFILSYRLIYYADHVITLTLHNAKLVPIVGTSFSENSTREDSLASHEGGNVLYAIQF